MVSCDPTAVFFENRYYNHSDHRIAGAIALDAVFPGAGNPHFFPEHLGEGLGVQEVFDVWLGWTNEPNRVEPSTPRVSATKVDGLGLHASQIAEGIAFGTRLLARTLARRGTRSAPSSPRSSVSWI